MSRTVGCSHARPPGGEGLPQGAGALHHLLGFSGRFCDRFFKNFCEVVLPVCSRQRVRTRQEEELMFSNAREKPATVAALLDAEETIAAVTPPAAPLPHCPSSKAPYRTCAPA